MSNRKNVAWYQNPRGLGWLLSSSAWSLILCGFYGSLWGVMAGATVGTCIVPIMGTVAGGIYGIPFGFLAGFVGGVIGGRWGGAIGGATGGLAGSYVVYSMGILSAYPFLLFGVPAALSLSSWFLGYLIGKRLEGGGKGRWQTALGHHLATSPLYLLPICARLMVGVLALLGIASALFQLAAYR